MKNVWILMPLLGVIVAAGWLLSAEPTRTARVPAVQAAPGHAKQAKTQPKQASVATLTPRRSDMVPKAPPPTVAERVERFVAQSPLAPELQERLPALAAQQSRLSQRLPRDATRSARHAQRAEREAFRLALREVLSLMGKHQRAAMRRHKLTITQLIRLAG